MTTRLDSWLALTEEEAIEPEMPILDPHHHFWERPDDVYLLENLLGDTGSGHRVNQTVFVECRSMYRTDGPHELRSVGEVEFVEGIASANVLLQSQDESGGSATAVAAGIVGNADLMLGDAVEPVLEALAEAGKGRFRGIRCTAAWDASPEINVARANSSGMLADANFRRGLACLERMGLSFDCIVYHPQLPEVADMARAFPNLTIILNHVGRPLGIGPYAGRREELMPEWRQGIDAVAECPNVVVKVGGLGNPISGFDWHQRPFPPGHGRLQRRARLTICTASRSSARTAVCLRATSRWISSPAHTPSAGMPSSASPRISRRRNRPTCSITQRRGRTGCRRCRGTDFEQRKWWQRLPPFMLSRYVQRSPHKCTEECIVKVIYCPLLFIKTH